MGGCLDCFYLGGIILFFVTKGEAPLLSQPSFPRGQLQHGRRFRALPAPKPGMAMTDAFGHFARGSAFAAKGQIAHAEAERQILATARKQTPADVEFSFYFNIAQRFQHPCPAPRNGVSA